MKLKIFETFKTKLLALLYEDYWNIGIAKTTITQFLQDSKPDVLWLDIANEGEFIADPFAITDPNNSDLIHVFCEIFSYRNQKGRIGHFTYNIKSETISDLHTVIEEDYHLSYPFLIKNDDNFFIIPESSENSAVSIYKSVEFPNKWKHVKNILDDYRGIDNTFTYLNGLWWMFSTDKEKGEHDYLNIFFSENLLGEWQAHPKNPVKKDKSSSRSAGTLFNYNSSLIRPSMDCTKKYGEQIYLNKILELNREKFSEEKIKLIQPYNSYYYSDKIHTLSNSGNNITIIDGCKQVLIFLDYDLLKAKFKKIYKNKINRFTSGWSWSF